VNDDTNKVFNFTVFKTKSKSNSNKTKKTKDKGCTEALYGEKSKCVMKIIPQKKNEPTFTIDDQCVKKRLDRE
jgi:hypothetical protein